MSPQTLENAHFSKNYVEILCAAALRSRGTPVPGFRIQCVGFRGWEVSHTPLNKIRKLDFSRDTVAQLSNVDIPQILLQNPEPESQAAKPGFRV